MDVYGYGDHVNWCTVLIIQVLCRWVFMVIMCFDITGVIKLVVYGSYHVRWYLSAGGGVLGDRGSRVYVHRRMGSESREPHSANMARPQN